MDVIVDVDVDVDEARVDAGLMNPGPRRWPEQRTVDILRGHSPAEDVKHVWNRRVRR